MNETPPTNIFKLYLQTVSRTTDPQPNLCIFSYCKQVGIERWESTGKVKNKTTGHWEDQLTVIPLMGFCCGEKEGWASSKQGQSWNRLNR